MPILLHGLLNKWGKAYPRKDRLSPISTLQQPLDPVSPGQGALRHTVTHALPFRWFIYATKKPTQIVISEMGRYPAHASRIINID